MKIRTRIAPSPTGFFHVGTARTVLFNYFFTKRNKGEIFLRIEDTDKERSKKEYENDIIASLKWLGINCDGDIERQSQHTDLYKNQLKNLMESGKAFFCLHSKEELENERKGQEQQKISHKHDCSHKNLASGNIKLKSDQPAIIRLKNSGGRLIFNDLIRGEVSFDVELLGDIVLAKSLDEPLYNFAVVVDDHAMQITHVIRGEDHISNTPKQILIQQALGFSQPQYAHVPLILGSDRSKLSKRHGAVSLNDYRELGYLPEAIINFLALLGWHPQGEQEIFNLEELIKEFDITRVQKGGAIFDINKLDSINHQYIQRLDDKELATYLAPYLFEFRPSPEQLIKITANYKNRLKKFSDIKDMAGFVFELPDYKSELLIWKNSSKKNAKENIESIILMLKDISGSKFENNYLTEVLMPLADQKGRGEVLWPLRAALSGQEKSSGPVEIMVMLGQKETLTRLEMALYKLQ